MATEPLGGPELKLVSKGDLALSLGEACEAASYRAILCLNDVLAELQTAEEQQATLLTVSHMLLVLANAGPSHRILAKFTEIQTDLESDEDRRICALNVQHYVVQVIARAVLASRSKNILPGNGGENRS